MNSTEKLSEAIGNISDRFICEAYYYQPISKMKKRLKVIGILAACFTAVFAVFVYFSAGIGVAEVYAYHTNDLYEESKPVYLPGMIDDNGEMKGHPLQFYIVGRKIESIRFSCKNEWLSCVDWTGQRGYFGLSKNFTVPYGSEEDYYYIVIDWVPQSITRQLTDCKNKGIADLLPEEKEDIIVMEVRFRNRTVKTMAIQIFLQDNGIFQAVLTDYHADKDDKFLRQPDTEPTKHQP